MNSITVAELAKIVNGKATGILKRAIHSIAALENARQNQVSFLSNPKFESQLNTTQAGCVLLSESNVIDRDITCIKVKDPYLAFAKIAQYFDTTPLPATDISERSCVHESVRLGSNVTIGHNAVISQNCIINDNVSIGANSTVGQNTTIGSDTIIYSNVTLYHDTKIGKRCILHAGVVIGADGFGYANDAGRWEKIPQIGSVIIGDDVEIGANATIDRGALEKTVIENGVKIDNLCHIAHNVTIGQNSAMAAFTGIAGSTKIGKSCTFSGRSSVIGHLEIADGTHLTACTLVNKSNASAAIYSSGTGAQENKLWRKNVARFKQLDEMAKKIRTLEKSLKSLQEK